MKRMFPVIAWLCAAVLTLGAATAPAQTINTNHSLHQALVDAGTNTSDASQAEREQNYREGLIDFALIRETYIRQGPPKFPEPLLALDGKPVRMIGFMNPYNSLESMKQFIILDRPTGCYFCKPPGWLEAVYARQDVKGDAKPPYLDGPILVTGTLRLWKDEGDFLFLIEHAKAESYDPTRPHGRKKRFLFF